MTAAYLPARVDSTLMRLRLRDTTALAAGSALSGLLAYVFFALATITRSMMATYLGVVFFISSFFVADGFAGNNAVAIAEPFAGRALKDAVRYWTVAERNVNLPELTGALLYNRLLWVSVAIGCVIFACAVYRFADQGMSKRERKKQKLAERASAETPRVAEATATAGVAGSSPSASARAPSLISA